MGVPKKQYLAGVGAQFQTHGFGFRLLLFSREYPTNSRNNERYFFLFLPLIHSCGWHNFLSSGSQAKTKPCAAKRKKKLIVRLQSSFPYDITCLVGAYCKTHADPSRKKEDKETARTRRDAKPAISSNNGRSISCQRMEVIKRPYAVCFLPRKAEGFTCFILEKGQRSSRVRKIVSVSINSISKGSSCP